jgi:hypothetical protein
VLSCHRTTGGILWRGPLLRRSLNNATIAN